ncbi:MAG: iron-sulfur cluster assembly accessory protein [Deltaproteobacteria bacterium]|nr:iron-sulfur cluster assembly accessory protein [Deltaproteobacteria bacterium]
MLTLTENAVKKVKDFRGTDPALGNKSFRIYIESGGCSGFQYGFAFDDKRDDDQVIPCGDLQILVDPASAEYLKGSVVDFVEDFSGAGFTVQNPNAKGSCGCGHSFNA